MNTKGEQLKARRKQLKLSVVRLAEMLDIPKERIYKWEKGTKPSTVEDHLKIDEFLSGKMEGFTNLEEPQEPYGIDYKAKYIQLLEKTLQEKEEKIKKLENSFVTEKAQTKNASG